MFKTFLESFVIVFIDDILVYSNTEEEHTNHILTVLGVLGRKSCMLNFLSVNFG